MPDDDYDDLEPSEEDSPVIAKLRKQLEEAQGKNKTLGTENALLAAGLGTLSDKQRKAILATHDGDLTPEALKNTAADLGFNPEPAPTPTVEEPQVPVEEQEAAQRVAEATGSAPASGASAPVSQEDKIKAMRGQATSIEQVDRFLSDEGLFLVNE